MARNLRSGLRQSLNAGLAGGFASNDIFTTASLDLNFAKYKNIGSLVTFTRASSGTYVGSDGLIKTATTNAPRFDHDPSTGKSLGLLVEESRTNLLHYSTDFDNTYWLQTHITTNAVIAPDGTLTAATYEGAGAAASVYNVTNATVTASTQYTYSIYIKLGTMSASDYKFAVYDASSASFIGSDLVPSVTPTATSWTRITYSFTTPSGCTAIRVYPFRNGSAITSSTVHFWGAQLEKGSPPTSYIPTEGSQGDRAADVASDLTRGSALRTLYAQFRSPASGTRPIVSVDDNTANERIEMFTSGTDPKLLVTDGGSAQADIDAGAITANTTARFATRFNTDNFAASVSGGAEVLDTTGTMPTVDRIRIGRDQAGNYLNGTIARITGWDSPLPLLPIITQ